MSSLLFTRVNLWATTAVLVVLTGCGSAPISPNTTTVPTVKPIEPPISVVPIPKIPPRIGLALGGGAARGFAHVGVIQVLEEAGIRPSLVVGTSAGSLVAAIYASGKTGAQLQQIALTMEEATFTDWTLPIFNNGMLRGDALARYVNGQVGSKVIEEHADVFGRSRHRLAKRPGHAVSAG